MRALLYLWSERIPLRSRYAPGAGPNAVSASDTFTRVVYNWAIRLPLQCGGRTCRGARGLQTVETTVHGENVIETPRRLFVWQFMKRDESVGFCAEGRRVLKSQLSQLQLGFFPFAVIPLLTSHLASPAADTLGRVDQGGLNWEGGTRLCHARLAVLFCAATTGSCL